MKLLLDDDDVLERDADIFLPSAEGWWCNSMWKYNIYIWSPTKVI